MLGFSTFGMGIYLSTQAKYFNLGEEIQLPDKNVDIGQYFQNQKALLSAISGVVATGQLDYSWGNIAVIVNRFGLLCLA